MYRSVLLSGLILLSSNPIYAQTAQEQVQRLLQQENAPAGVVFEIAENDAQFLDKAVPTIKRYAQQLRQQFPKLPIAVVSHGKEIFALTHTAKSKNQSLQNKVKSLVKDEQIPVHVCGTFASWYQTKLSDFPDYINVTPAGPAKVSAYEDQGFEVIRLE